MLWRHRCPRVHTRRRLAVGFVVPLPHHHPIRFFPSSFTFSHSTITVPSFFSNSPPLLPLFFLSPSLSLSRSLSFSHPLSVFSYITTHALTTALRFDSCFPSGSGVPTQLNAIEPFTQRQQQKPIPNCTNNTTHNTKKKHRRRKKCFIFHP